MALEDQDGVHTRLIPADPSSYPDAADPSSLLIENRSADPEFAETRSVASCLTEPVQVIGILAVDEVLDRCTARDLSDQVQAIEVVMMHQQQVVGIDSD